jgi:outer membrane protein
MTLLVGSAGAQGRIGTVDLRKVFDNYWKRKQAEDVIKDRAADMEKEYKNMVTDFDKAREDYQKLLTSANEPALSSDERDKRKREAEDKLKALKENEDTINQYKRQAATTLDEQRRRMRDNILSEIRNVVNAKAKSAGYSMVIDTASESVNNTPIVLFNNNENDITEQVLSQLNIAAPADAAKADQKKDEPKDDKKKDAKK